MAQVVSRRPVTAEVRVRARFNPCGICGGQSGTGTGFSPSSSGLPCQYHSIVTLQTHIIWKVLNMLTKRAASTLGSDPPHLQGKNRLQDYLGLGVCSLLRVVISCRLTTKCFCIYCQVVSCFSWNVTSTAVGGPGRHLGIWPISLVGSESC
jgi:hypothetical protein